MLKKQRTDSSYLWEVHCTGSLVLSVNAGRNERCIVWLLYNSNSDLQVVVFFCPLPFSPFSSAPHQLSDGPWLRRGSDGYRLHPALLLQSAAGSAAHLQSGQGQQDTVGKKIIWSVWAPFLFLFFYHLLPPRKPPHPSSLFTFWPVLAGESQTRREMQTMKASGAAMR